MRVVKTLLQRCGEVIEFMAAAGAPCRLSDVAAALDLPKSATHRLLRELCALGWMEQSGADGPYALTLRFALVGHRVLQASRLPDLVQPVLDALAAQTRELVRLTVATEQGLVWFASAQGAPPGLVYQPAMDGEVVLHATANGKAFLSTLTDADALKLARRGGLGERKPTPRTIDTAAALREELAGIRVRGYAVAVEEAEPGITAVSVAVRRLGRAAVGTVSVAGPSMRIGPERVPALAAALREAAVTLGNSGQALIKHRGGSEVKLEFAGAGRRFGPLQAVAPVDLGVDEGEFIAIVGPSGCGKSTLLRMVSGLIPVSEGEIRVGGRTVRGPVTELGIVFQQPVLLDWRSALGNVLFQVEMRGQRPGPFRARAMDLLEQVGLKDFAGAHPHALSGGMRQRVAIARALVHDPGLLLMDEPFGALDALTREQMRVDLEALWLRRRMTVLFVTHSVDEAVLLADRVVVMSPRPGKVDRVLAIDIPRPRGLAARRHPEFLAREEEITDIFLARGILRREAA